MKPSHDSVADFVRYRVEELIKQEVQEQRVQEYKPITLRLPTGHIALIDLLAHELDFTRQAFLQELVSEALEDAVRAMVGTLPEEQRVDAYTHYMAVMEGTHEQPEASDD